jgi:hypothetical protein
MKLTKWVKLLFVIVAVPALSGGSVWEGAAASGGDFPESGFYVATNSFPRNTVVDIINLENGKNIRVIVAAGLETPGLLAALSGNAAELLGLRSGSVGRIRMTQPSDPIAFSRFTEGMAAYRDDYVPWTAVGEPAYTPPSPDPAPFIGMNDTGDSPFGDSPLGDSPLEDSLAEDDFIYSSEPAWDEFSRREVVDLPDAAPEETDIPAFPPEPGTYDYTLIPAEERPPENPSEDLIDPAYIIPGIAAAPEKEPAYPANIPARASAKEISPSPFSVPVISSLERGKYYVQIGAFSRPELVESAISPINKGYPLAIQNAGSEAKPVYRILLGPLNLGESGAMLQRVRSIGYTDAFVRGNK